MKNMLKVFAPCYMAASLLLFSCAKEIESPQPVAEAITNDAVGNSGHLKQTKTFSSDVVVSWINMQLAMLKGPRAAGIGAPGTDRSQGYTSIALYEAVVPGMPAYQSLTGQLTDFPAMPTTEPGKAYHWAASANAAMAEMSRRLFPTASGENKAAINSLENTLKTSYADEVDAATLTRSIAFGKEVAMRIANWADTDGSGIVNPAYVVPTGPGIWVPTAATAPINPFMHQRRLLVPGSDEGTALAPLPQFSTDPSSPFYAMVKHVYDVSKTLTTDQKAMADYYKDNPGYGPGGGFVWCLQEAFKIAQPMLDQAALTFAKVGLATHDVTLVLFRAKYTFNVIRPVTYIRAYIDPNWNTYIPTPNHPEFPSGHATSNGAILTMMSHSFGENFPLTQHTYDYLGYAPRHVNNWAELSKEASDSRIYGGLHYVETQEKSLVQGKKVAANILSKVKFHK